MTTREFIVGPEFNLPKVIATAEKLAARAQRKGLSGGYTVTTEQRVETIPDKSSAFYVEGSAFNPTRQALVTYLTIEGEPVKYDGWAFVAVVEYENGQPVVSGSPWYEGEQVDRDALKPGYCDHCKTIRRRGKTIIVESEAGERKQVGTSCVKDFLGQEVNGAWYSTKDPFEEMDGYGGSRGEAMYPIVDVMQYAAQVIRQAGYVPSYMTDKRPTISDVTAVMGLAMRDVVEEARKQFGEGPEAEDVETAERALAFARTMEGDSDYAMNLRAVTAGEWITRKRFGLVISAVGVMLKAEGKAREEAAKAAMPITEALFAEPKTKIEITDAVVTDVFGFETQWGFSQIIILVGQGYRFKWMTSSDPGLKAGDVVDFRATVKGEDDYNGRISTQVLRVKATVKEEAAA